MASSNIMAFQEMILSPRGAKVAVVVNRDAGDFMLTQGSIRGPKFAGEIKDSYIGFGFSRKSKNLHLYRPFLNAASKLLANKTIDKILTENKPPLLPVKK
jgi:ABC-type amino acid transport substrate-binding protein